MDSLKMKAKAGVTLVELLVVILIVTILSVSMLPLLQPFVTEAQYAAEAIPVIGNLRTKVGLYVYEKGQLPFNTSLLEGMKPHEQVETWMPKKDDASGDVYSPAYYSISDITAPRTEAFTTIEITDKTEKGAHIQNMLDVDYQDLKGKRSKPVHYQYLALSTNTQSYVIGCFGNGNGLKAGTGYAVCELNFPQAGRKLIGTWKRYKSYNDEAGAIAFTNSEDADETSGKVLDCYVPKYDDLKAGTTSEEVDNIMNSMTGAGWEF